jgi:hypothetical protein
MTKTEIDDMYMYMRPAQYFSFTPKVAGKNIYVDYKAWVIFGEKQETIRISFEESKIDRFKEDILNFKFLKITAK